MDNTRVHTPSVSILSDLKEVTKMGLSLSVVFSCVAGYFLGAESLDLVTILMLAVGGYCLVGASNTYNQIIEKDTDALMDRTRNRPIPTGRLSVNLAFVIASSLTLLGLVILYMINPKSAMFGAICIFMYVCMYTPLRSKTPLSVFVGAFPGAIPFMLGWVAATGEFSIEAGTLFMIQFFWQFPHFWALGWWLFDDYKKGGFFMLPTGKRDKTTAVQIVLYTVWTVVVSLIPVFGFTGRLELSIVGGLLVLASGLMLLHFALKLYKDRNTPAAKKLMFASVSYITLLQLIFVLDKYIRIWI